jgi:hypothetical protein
LSSSSYYGTLNARFVGIPLSKKMALYILKPYSTPQKSDSKLRLEKNRKFIEDEEIKQEEIQW